MMSCVFRPVFIGMDEQTREDVIMDVESILDNLSSIRVLYFTNEFTDVQLYDVDTNEGLTTLINSLFGSVEDTFHLQMRTTMDQCPAIKLVMSSMGDSEHPINYKLQSFLYRMRLCGVGCRCEKALAIGYSNMSIGSCAVDIPSHMFDIFCRVPFVADVIDLGVLQILGEDVQYDERMKYSCEACSKAKRMCSKQFPCKECIHRDITCEMSQVEIVHRARSLYVDVFTGAVPHCDVAKIQLSLQMPVGRYKLRPTDMMDIEARVGARGSPGDRKKVCDIPTSLKDMIAGQMRWKVEWMTYGVYQLRASQAYGNQIFDPTSIAPIATRHKIPFKLVDTCNMAWLSAAYRMWTESIVYPGKIIRYEGESLDKKTRVLKMCTIILEDPYTMVTATTVE